jgi:hypothetical protein
LWMLLNNEPISTSIPIANFQGYWQRANEKISSSYSRLHFGHYKAASFSKDLSALHAAILTACSRKELPLQHWGVGLTVLLEKTCGNNHIHKMGAIVLLEGDFNYYNKTIFAQQMMTSVQDRGQIPLECFAKKVSNCVYAIMTKIVMCDMLRIHHHPTCVGGNDFGDCYDRIAHPPAGVALQSWRISKESVCLILMAMQTMQFFLHTGFGESAEMHGSTDEDRTLELGQENAVAGPGFMALSAQNVNAYLQDGHGSRTMTSYTFQLFVLAAVLYVNDMDLIHTTALVTATPSELFEQSQISTNAWGGLAIATGASLKPEKCFAYFQVLNSLVAMH